MGAFWATSQVRIPYRSTYLFKILKGIFGSQLTPSTLRLLKVHLHRGKAEAKRIPKLAILTLRVIYEPLKSK